MHLQLRIFSFADYLDKTHTFCQAKEQCQGTVVMLQHEQLYVKVFFFLKMAIILNMSLIAMLKSSLPKCRVGHNIIDSAVFHCGVYFVSYWFVWFFWTVLFNMFGVIFVYEEIHSVLMHNALKYLMDAINFCKTCFSSKHLIWDVFLEKNTFSTLIIIRNNFI